MVPIVRIKNNSMSCDCEIIPLQASRSHPSPTMQTFLDLSYSLGEETIFWPGGEGFKLCIDCCDVAEENSSGGYFYAAGTFTCAEHGGCFVSNLYRIRIYNIFLLFLCHA